MSDDLRAAVDKMKSDITLLRGDVQSAKDAMIRVDDRLALFQVHVEEVFEMLLTHDTEQLKRVASVEAQNDRLLEMVGNLRRRVEALEKKAG